MGLRRYLFTDYNEPRLVVPGLFVVLASFLLALALITATSRPRTAEQKAEALLRSGKPAQAERAYRDLLRERPTPELVLAFLDAHQYAKVFARLAEKRDESSPVGSGIKNPETPLDEEEVDRAIDELPPDVRVIGQYARAVPLGQVPPELATQIEEGAKREPPVPYANRLLARELRHQGKLEEAARHLEREGLAFPERSEDVDLALEIRIQTEDWETLRDRLTDPRVAAAAGPHPKYRLAVHDRDWKAAMRWLPALWAPRFVGTGFAMSAVTALGWFFFCARLGKLGQRPAFRLPMYLLAFVLGVASVVPTVLLIAVEEAKFHIVETGDATRDLLFFIFGVGLREEASKLLLFLPLLPILRKKGDKLDVLVCGAMVGLGFAAEENLGYLAQGDLQTGLGRFLTANFFHMAMTGTLASALDDFVSDREKYAPAFTRTSLFIVGIHGAYDFLLSHPEYGGGYFAMTAFVFLTRMFLEAVDAARRRADRGITPLHAFVFAVALVTGVSLAYATIAVGPKGALVVTGGGLLGVAIIVYVFVRTLGQMR
ncbi:MAG: PrsW family intramembrane metalloprotease [Labilithrix sp.]|nr:PrsW family intramembrane metalloprotease [Labilithrix sp.]MCW5816239.1 PrsW family intramembrane metalloprotease [Labilithrix sp.]